MQILIAQLNFSVGDFEGNLSKILECLKSAPKKALVVFPECSLCGYPPQDLLDFPSFVEQSEAYAQKLIQQAGNRDFLFGSVERNKGLGKPIRNVAYFVEAGQLKHKYFKRLLPTYDVFDEDRFFEPGREPLIVEYKGEKIGVSICEDIWGDLPGTNLRNRYNQSPLEDSRQATILINLSASPFESKKVKLKREMLQRIAVKYSLPFIYVNAVGANDSLVFDGRSYFWRPDGRLGASAKAFEEESLFIDTEVDVPPVNVHLKNDEIENIYDALVLGIKDYCQKTGFQKCLLGLSGGIDSAVVACLAEDALGAGHVDALILPSRYTSSESKDDAREQARLQNIQIHELDIEAIFESSLETLASLFASRPPDVTEENLQSRIRALLLMAYSNKFGHLLLTTGNKSELATGYCTLYGDMNGGLAPLSDVYKTQVYELGKEANRRKRRIPDRVFVKAPTAELRPNQSDQDSLPAYEKLDAILFSIIEEFKGREALLLDGHHQEDIDLVFSLFSRNEYKRYQMPLGLKVSSKAFGIGRRLPLVQKFY